jgi:hypothetical protein
MPQRSPNVAARLTDEYREAMWSALVAEGNARDRLQAGGVQRSR